MTIKKSYTTSQAIADQVAGVSMELGIPESSIVTMAIHEFLLKYHEQKHRLSQLKSVA